MTSHNIHSIKENGSHLIINYLDGVRAMAVKASIGLWLPKRLVPGPPTLSVSNITHNSARLSIVKGDGVTPDQWRTQLSKSSTFATTVANSGSNPYNATGLSPETTYYARSRAAYRGLWGEWGNTVTFKTKKEPVNEGFRWPFPPGDIGTEWEGYPGHKGVDFPKPSGTPIRASNGGKVTLSGWYDGGLWGWGNVVELEHAGGLSTVYAHMVSAPPVSVGQTVNKWDVIGYVGTTGNSSGNHLHWETAVGGRWNQINPRTFMAQYGE